MPRRVRVTPKTGGIGKKSAPGEQAVVVAVYAVGALALLALLAYALAHLAHC